MLDLRGKRIAFTGRLASMSRAEAKEAVSRLGGNVICSVTADTNVLVIGRYGLPIEGAGTLRRKIEIAQALNAHGANIAIVPEESWLSAAGIESNVHVHKLLSAGDVCELVGATRQQLRTWVRFGLAHPAHAASGVSYFDFLQVTAAKKIIELTRAGVRTCKIRRSIVKLQSWMSGVESPLVQLSIVEQNGSLLVRMEQGQLADPEGQMHFEFPEEHPPAYHISHSSRTPQWWFERGCEHEEAGDFNDAVESYRQALLLGGPAAEICFNLANVLYKLGLKAQASERYRQAVEIDPDFVEAWNNLGITLAEMKQCDDALWAYRKAIELNPRYADAHYNLADCLDRNGCTTDARTHWEAYIRLDPASPWGSYAQERLGERAVSGSHTKRSRSRDTN